MPRDLGVAHLTVETHRACERDCIRLQSLTRTNVDPETCVRCEPRSRVVVHRTESYGFRRRLVRVGTLNITNEGE